MSHDHRKRSLCITWGFVCFHMFFFGFLCLVSRHLFRFDAPKNGRQAKHIGQAGLRDEVQALGYRTRGGPEDAGMAHGTY